MDQNEVTVKIEWNHQREFPDELSEAQNGFSVDVFIHNTKTDEHTVGWFDFNQMKWFFLQNEEIKKFKWRYFIKTIDNYGKQNKKVKTKN